MNLYNFVKFGHIVAVIAWVGGGMLMQVLAARARAASPEKMFGLAQEAAWLGNRFFASASFGTLAFGIAAAVTGPHWGFKPLWIKLGLVGFGLTALNGALILGRTSKAMSTLGAERGASDPEVARQARRLLNFMNIDLVIVLLVILDMVFKPT